MVPFVITADFGNSVRKEIGTTVFSAAAWVDLFKAQGASVRIEQCGASVSYGALMQFEDIMTRWNRIKWSRRP